VAKKKPPKKTQKKHKKTKKPTAMAFSLGHLLEALLLIVNGLAVLQDFSPSLVAGQPPIPRFLAQGQTVIVIAWFFDGQARCSRVGQDGGRLWKRRFHQGQDHPAHHCCAHLVTR
jgi:hypothetical protein